MNHSPDGPTAELSAEELQSLENLKIAYQDVRRELGKVIVGQEAVLEQLMIAIFARAVILLSVSSILTTAASTFFNDSFGAQHGIPK